MEQNSPVWMVLPDRLNEELLDCFLTAHDAVGLSSCKLCILLRRAVASWRRRMSGIDTCSLCSVYE
jgi:hypothetical protein